MRAKVDLYIDPAQAKILVEEGWEGLRPDLVKYAAAAAQDFVNRLRKRLTRLGSGRFYLRDGVRVRASAPGDAPARRSGEYERSFATDTKSLKKSVQGRIGSRLWHIGRMLEYGTRRIRPRPHVRPTFAEWKNNLNRKIG